MKELTKLDFVTQSNISHIYRHFYNEFLEFSKQFIEKNEIITTQVKLGKFFINLSCST